MREQPVPSVTAEDVRRIVRREFREEHVAEVEALLATYGDSEWHHEPARVRMAILKLSRGDLEKLKHNLEVARGDYRDVLFWAEYPEYSLRHADAAEDELEAAIERDWLQYQDWLRCGG